MRAPEIVHHDVIPKGYKSLDSTSDGCRVSYSKLGVSAFVPDPIGVGVTEVRFKWRDVTDEARRYMAHCAQFTPFSPAAGDQLALNDGPVEIEPNPGDVRVLKAKAEAEKAWADAFCDGDAHKARAQIIERYGFFNGRGDYVAAILAEIEERKRDALDY